MLESIVRFHWNTSPAVPLLIICGGFLHTQNSRVEQVQPKPYSLLGPQFTVWLLTKKFASSCSNGFLD